jgi:rRNA maturation endonuclease Nob1
MEFDINKRFKECVTCGTTDFSEIALFCKMCGDPLYNSCTKNECGHINSPEAHYCEICGSETYLIEKYAEQLHTDTTEIREDFLRNKN